MTANKTAPAPAGSEGREVRASNSNLSTRSPQSDQETRREPRDRVLAVLRAAYRAAAEEQDQIAEDIVTLISIARAVERGACDPAVGLARAVELGLVALDGDEP